TKNETVLDPVLKNGLAFADEKLEEIKLLAEHLDGVANLRYDEHVAAYDALQAADFRNVELEDLSQVRTERESTYDIRQKVQQERLQLPLLPTTTIGSFPQSPEVR
ncbi:5-methyltetrahydropteroyltriglutamate--homocysteine S-methyltransferase, partial [Streptococcus suis]